MDAIENSAYVSVGRACGFAGLAIFCVIFGLSFDPVLASRTGAGLCLGLAVVLLAYAHRAPMRNYKRTELWLILAKEQRPPAAYAQRVIGNALHGTYLWFAKQATIIGIVLLALSVIFQVFDVTGLWAEPNYDAATIEPAPRGGLPDGIPIP